jgi:hypothetical protein
MTLKTLFGSLPTLPAPVARLLRVAGFAAIAVVVPALIALARSGVVSVTDLRTVAILGATAALVAVDKYLRDAGVY